jgi:hypothetical protein
MGFINGQFTTILYVYRYIHAKSLNLQVLQGNKGTQEQGI